MNLKTIRKRMMHALRTHVGLVVIIFAALLIELTTGVMFYTAQTIIQRTMERLVEREMNSIYLGIRNQLAKVEVTLDNMAWVVTDDLSTPDSLFRSTVQLVQNNPAILGSSISCIPNYYPQRGRLFEPYAVRRADGTIESMQLGSENHDYTQKEFYTEPIAKGSGHWCEPYLDKEGAQAMVTTYAVPVRDGKGKIVAVVDADISLGWLDSVMNEGKMYESTKRFLVTGNYNLLAGEDCPIFKSSLEQLKADSDKIGYLVLKDEHGKKKHVFFHPVGGKTDWMLINILDDGDVFGKLRHVRLFLLLMVLTGLLLLGFIVWRISRNLERLRRVNAEKERISSELRIAKNIQKQMLPETFPPYPERDDIDIYGSLVPAREVGGDLFDFFLRDEKLFFCIGDVSGKGVPSAMVMSVVHSLFRMASAHESNPARIMQTINETTCENNETNMFVTMFIGILDLPTGRMRYCNAGHDIPVIVGHEALPAKPNLPVGLFNDFTYEMQEMVLENGSMLFLYTDGLTEAKNSAHKQFGLDRIMQVLSQSVTLTPTQLLGKMTEEVHAFVKDAEQSDDLTMLAIRYSPVVHNRVLDEELILQNDVHQVKELNAFVKQVMAQLDVEPSLAKKLRLAVEEAVVNVMDYAYPPGTTGDIIIHVTSDGEALNFVITDSGVAFDPTVQDKADTTLSAEDRPIGGLGILLVREMMDTINYERTDGKNVLLLRKLRIKELSK
jgi:sigma-B regulation protein RsbU (phosphoserine phosphatase)